MDTDSPIDLKYAREVADFFKLQIILIIMTKDESLASLEKVI